MVGRLVIMTSGIMVKVEKKNAKASEEGLSEENGGRTSFSFKVMGRIVSIFKKN